MCFDFGCGAKDEAPLDFTLSGCTSEPGAERLGKDICIH